MLSIQLHMPDLGLVVMRKSWEGASPLYHSDQPLTHYFGELLDQTKIANEKHGVSQRHTPDFLRGQRLSQNQIAHLLRYALSTWEMHHKQINQRMLAWAVDVFTEFLPILNDVDKSAAIDLIALKKGESFKDPALQKRAPYELEKAQTKLRQYQGNDPVQFTYLLLREVGEAMQRAQGSGGMSLGQLFRR
jgi:hypothetical protein